MKFLAISGSLRAGSTNTAMLSALQSAAAPKHLIALSQHSATLPIFSPDLEGLPLPTAVEEFCKAIDSADGIIIASPEYVRAIPGGLKNAIDWLVSRDEVVAKPIALIHASHRGDDMLHQLPLVLGTVSQRFNPDLFLRFHLMKLSPDEAAEALSSDRHKAEMCDFLDQFARFCRSG